MQVLNKREDELQTNQIGWWLVLGVTGLLTLTCLIIFGIRLDSVLNQSDLFATTGIEGPGIYDIWKVQNGHPLYEIPIKPYFSTSLYNYAFFYSYAALSSLLGAQDASMMITSRVFTCAFAIFGAICHWFLLRYLLKNHRSPRLNIFLGMLVFVLWLGTCFAKWWPLTVRPDVAAAAFVILALLVYMMGEEKNSLPTIIAASLLFYVAWAFKATYIWTLAGTGLYILVYRRNLRNAIALGLPFALLAGGTLLIGDDAYRFNLLTASTYNGISIPFAFGLMVKTIVPNLFVFGFLVAVPFVLRDFSKKPEVANTDLHDPLYQSQFMMLMFITIASFAFSFFTSGRDAADTNYYYEAYLSAATLAIICLVKLADGTNLKYRNYGLYGGAVLIATMLVMPTLQLTSPNGVASLAGFQTSGPLRLATPEDYTKVKDFAAYIDTKLPKPVFIRDEVLAQPWHATQNKYPTVLVDYTFYTAATRKGALQGQFRDLVLQKKFGSVLVVKNDDFGDIAPAARQAGYTLTPLPDEFDRMGWQLYLLNP